MPNLANKLSVFYICPHDSQIATVRSVQIKNSINKQTHLALQMQCSPIKQIYICNKSQLRKSEINKIKNRLYEYIAVYLTSTSALNDPKESAPSSSISTYRRGQTQRHSLRPHLPACLDVKPRTLDLLGIWYPSCGSLCLMDIGSGAGGRYARIPSVSYSEPRF